MQLKPQELLILFKVAANAEARWSYAALGQTLFLSAGEVHGSVRRAIAAGLAVSRGRGDWSVVKPALLEFATHGVRYAFPAGLGPVRRGVPTAHAVEPLASHIVATAGETPVWPSANGSAKGPSVEPLYRTVPKAALADPALHRLLALQDAIRIGRARERQLAAEFLAEALDDGA